MQVLTQDDLHLLIPAPVVEPCGDVRAQARIHGESQPRLGRERAQISQLFGRRHDELPRPRIDHRVVEAGPKGHPRSEVLPSSHLVSGKVLRQGQPCKRLGWISRTFGSFSEVVCGGPIVLCKELCPRTSPIGLAVIRLKRQDAVEICRSAVVAPVGETRPGAPAIAAG